MERTTRFLSAQTGVPLTLPTEAQWEVAVRSVEARRWPWGGADPTPHQINADPAHVRRTSPVGVFPAGDGQGGLVDLAGNVWEWTSSAYASPVGAESAATAVSEEAARRAVRGGVWGDDAGGCRAGCRYSDDPDVRDNGMGFRVACRCPIPNPEP
jgi:formylglycine-generating enzyme required for sulfatase activity